MIRKIILDSNTTEAMATNVSNSLGDRLRGCRFVDDRWNIVVEFKDELDLFNWMVSHGVVLAETDQSLEEQKL